MKNIKMIQSFILTVMIFCTVHDGYGQVNIGDQAPEIELKSLDRTIVKLSDYTGKIILVDFWASWCGPCRKANPDLEKIYLKNKDKDFIILGVSLDTKVNSWIAAIKKDKLTYPQVIDVKNWNSEVAESYGVEKLPSSFLINKMGKIIALDPSLVEIQEAIQL